MTTVLRQSYLDAIESAFRINPICALLGPRQCGKTTASKQFIDLNIYNPVHIFDLEDPDDLKAFENPKLLLESLDGLIVIDEVQRRPELFPYLRVLVDRKPSLKILILGSASAELIRQSSETLAGRISYLEMTLFSLQEVENAQNLWVRGGFPKSYLADNDVNSFRWRQDYVRTFLEMDLPSFGFNLNPYMIRRFWLMLSDYHGNLFKASELGRSLDLNDKTVKRYLDILSGTFVVRQLQPWFVNISKRQVKSCKIYFRDSGLLHSMLNLQNFSALSTSSKVGASWEGFALEEIIRYHNADFQDCFFWATQAGAEVDLLIVQAGHKKAFEFKYTNNPSTTKSMHIAMETLGLDQLTVIIPGNAAYFLNENIRVYGLERYLKTSQG
ncbi:MAG: ATP-binding protein [Alphaproteobacteria bacterium]